MSANGTASAPNANPSAGWAVRRREADGELLVDWEERRAPSSHQGSVAITFVNETPGLVFYVERSDGLRLRVSEIGMAEGLANENHSLRRRLDEMPFLAFARQIVAAGSEIGHRICDEFDKGNRFGAKMISPPREIR